MNILKSIGRQITAISDTLGFERRDIKKDLDLPRAFFKSSIINTVFKWDYHEIERYVMFVGYPRSGHTLVGSLLNAHPEIVISHELDALYYLRAGFDRERIFSLILEKDKVFSGQGAAWQGYNYEVNQWQGKYKTLKVIGDKKGGKSSRHLQARPDIIDQLREVVQVPIRLIHIVRHPLDNIATHKKRWKVRQTLQEAIDDYFNRVEANSKLRKEIGSSEWCELSLEHVINNSKESMKKLTDFLNVNATDDFFVNTADKIFNSPHKSRNKINWPKDMINEVAERSQKYEFLNHYEFKV